MQLSSTPLFVEACFAGVRFVIKCFWRFRCQLFSALSTSPLRELKFSLTIFIVFLQLQEVLGRLPHAIFKVFLISLEMLVEPMHLQHERFRFNFVFFFMFLLVSQEVATETNENAYVLCRVMSRAFVLIFFNILLPFGRASCTAEGV